MGKNIENAISGYASPLLLFIAMNVQHKFPFHLVSNSSLFALDYSSAQL